MGLWQINDTLEYILVLLDFRTEPFVLTRPLSATTFRSPSDGGHVWVEHCRNYSMAVLGHTVPYSLDSFCRVVGMFESNAGHDAAATELLFGSTFSNGVCYLEWVAVNGGPSRLPFIDYTGKTLADHIFINDIDGGGLVVMLESNSRNVCRWWVLTRIVCAVLFALPSLLL